MGTIEGGRIQIPFIRTHGVGVGSDAPHISSRRDPDGPIKQKIEAVLKNPPSPILQVGDFAEVVLDSVRKHHKQESWVHWLPKVHGNHVEPWVNPSSWQELIRSEFLSEFQEKVFAEAEAGNPFYMQFGFSKFNHTPQEGFAKQGGMSINRAHMHSTPRFDMDDIDGYISPHKGMSNKDVRNMALFFDYGAKLARENISQAKDFSSHKHTWLQMDGLVERTAYGFSSLQEALVQLLNTFTSLAKDEQWTKMATKLYKKYAQDYTVDVGNEVKSLVLFSPIPGGALFIPTPEERMQMGISEDNPCKVWVSLFSPIMKPQIVNGVQVIRE